MAKYRIAVMETVWHTYEVEIPDDVPEREQEDYFYEMDADEQKAGLIESESCSWEIDEIEKV